jgi:paired amphipathic helix protein Sin3a
MTSVNSASSSSSSSSTPTPNSSSNGSNNNNNNNNNSNNGTNNSATNQFYRLKVEDALSYLDQVKFQFEKQPEVYNQFLDIMKEFKSQSIDTPGVISRVSNLFRGHTDLIEGFNTFLPPGYKIEVQANDSVHFTAPNSNLSTLVQPISNFQTTIINSENKASTNNHVSATLVNLPGSIVNKNNEPIKMDPLIITPIPLNNGANTNNSNGFKNITQNNAAQLSVKIITNPTATNNASNNVVQPTVKSNLSSTPPPINPQSNSSTSSTSSNNVQTSIMNAATPTGTAAPQSQVEFGHAINYVNKIKSRFLNQPDIYKSFLEILHTYQKQQKNIKEVF